MQINKQDLAEIKGGAVTASLINAIFDGLQKIFDFGRTFGSAIARHYTKKTCY